MEKLTTYISIVWIGWIAWVSFAIYFKWSKQRDTFFYTLYAALIISYGIISLTYDSQSIENYTETKGLSPGTILLIKNFVISLGLTAFLQLSVWWFTRRWHRR